MHVIGQRNVHGVDFSAAQAIIVSFIGVSLDAVLLAHGAPFDRIPGNHGSKLAIFRMGKGGQHGHLSDMPEPNHRVADLAA